MREAGADFRGQNFDPAHPGWIRVEELTLADTGALLPLLSGVDLTAAQAPSPEETVVRVPLPEPLPPSGALRLDVRWTAQLPRVFARTGFAGDFFMAGQWYPKLSVHDRGRWDTEPWHANAEFFADFGSYDLALTVPGQYVTGASGVRQGESANGDGTKTVRYRAERVTDIAWTAWPDFQIFNRDIQAAGATQQVEILLPPDEAGTAEWHFMAAAAALDAYGRWYGPYPWPKLTVVVPPPGAGGAGGMEYPTLVTTGRSLDLPLGLESGIHELAIVTAHEIAHQWFPMQVQSNEAAEPWLDEGFADYLTIRVLGRMYGSDQSLLSLPFLRLGYEDVQRSAYIAVAPRQPLAQPAWKLPTPSLYAATMYGKGSIALLSLERTLGDERFTAALRAYADRWRWRHPTTADLQASLEEATGERLDWFFSSFVYGGKVIDYRVAAMDDARIVVERRGGVGYPVEVRLTLADGTSRTEHWDGVAERLELDGGGRPIAAVAIDPAQHVALQLSRLNDARVEQPDLMAPLEVANRWLDAVQVLLQLFGQIG
jgi:aminopeptidase N